MGTIIWQFGLFFVIAIILGSWWGDELGTESAVVMLVAVIAVAATFFGSNITHELREVNDQLAGRSPEFHEFLSEQAGTDTTNI